METIKINDMQTKGVVFIVKYQTYHGEGQDGGEPSEATLNTTFNKEMIYYLENEVGIGGTVSVQITNKSKDDGTGEFWVNITKVDMKSGVKGIATATMDHANKHDKQVHKTLIEGKTSLMSAKDISITAQCLTKCYGYGSNVSPQEVLEAYRFFVLELEQNG